MDRDGTVEFFLECEAARAEARDRALAEGKSEYEADKTGREAAKAKWNGWVEALLAERKALEEAGEWDAESDRRGGLTGKNDQTTDWLKRASVDFSRCRFEPKPSLRGADAPKQSSDSHDTELDRHGADAPRDDYKFVILLKSRVIDFRNFIFPCKANFRSVAFSGDADFDAAAFTGTAGFNRTTFSRPAFFHSADFSSDATFVLAHFEGPADFGDCQFAGDASFRSIRSGIGFDLSDAHFERVPDFTQSTLHRDPRLDNVTVKRGSWYGPFWREARHEYDHREFFWRTGRYRIDRDAPAKFRELKRYAIQGEDHIRELEFHAQEIRTSRWVTDYPLRHPRFWFGVLYEIFSNFGRSIWRPAFAMALLTTLSAACFLKQSADLSGRSPDYASLIPERISPWPKPRQSCIPVKANAALPVQDGMKEIADRTDAATEAWSLALKNTFVFINWDRADAARRNFGCLYGLTTDGRLTFPYVPSSVSFASLIQIILSSILLFLLLLGIRNMLKLK